MELIGKIEHSAYDGKVVFSFRRLDPRKTKNQEDDIFSYEQVDVPFEIWSRFKGKKVKITISKED